MKGEKQKINWESQAVDVQIKDLVEKIGRNYVINSLATHQ